MITLITSLVVVMIGGGGGKDIQLKKQVGCTCPVEVE